MVLTLVDPVSRKQICMRLVTPDARVLTDPAQSLEDAGLKDGDQLTAIVGQANLASTDTAFASWCCGGDGVVTWGNSHSGGHSSAVQDQLRSVQQVQATDGAFAAILEDGSVVTWGDPGSGGNSFAVRDQLRSVRQVQHLLQCWKTTPLLHGAMQLVVVTALLLKIS